MKLTDTAATMITDMVRDGHRPTGAGLRIAPREDHEALAMSLADVAQPDDVVVRTLEAQVFLAPVADARLDGQTLDARTNEVGSAFFVQP